MVHFIGVLGATVRLLLNSFAVLVLSQDWCRATDPKTKQDHLKQTCLGLKRGGGKPYLPIQPLSKLGARDSFRDTLYITCMGAG